MTPPPGGPRLATVLEACAYGKISRTTLYRWMEAGHVKAIKRSHRNVRVDLDSLDKYLKTFPDWADANGRTKKTA